MTVEKLTEPVRAKVKIRYNDEGNDALITQLSDDVIQIEFDQPQKAVTPGQSSVFYVGEDVLGGGIIDKVLE
jgi:tRNA-specific 2-thiouridylase